MSDEALPNITIVYESIGEYLWKLWTDERLEIFSTHVIPVTVRHKSGVEFEIGLRIKVDRKGHIQRKTKKDDVLKQIALKMVQLGLE